MERSYRFALVADMLALTIKEPHQGSGGAFTLVTDAYAVDGDVLTLHRQLSSVSASGAIATMAEPTNNFRHTFVYRRAWHHLRRAWGQSALWGDLRLERSGVA